MSNHYGGNSNSPLNQSQQYIAKSKKNTPMTSSLNSDQRIRKLSNTSVGGIVDSDLNNYVSKQMLADNNVEKKNGEASRDPLNDDQGIRIRLNVPLVIYCKLLAM